MTQMLIAIAVWCGGSYVNTRNDDCRKMGQLTVCDSKFQLEVRPDQCRQVAVDCMQARNWKESELLYCLGMNKDKKSAP